MRARTLFCLSVDHPAPHGRPPTPVFEVAHATEHPTGYIRFHPRYGQAVVDLLTDVCTMAGVFLLSAVFREVHTMRGAGLFLRPALQLLSLPLPLPLPLLIPMRHDHDHFGALCFPPPNYTTRTRHGTIRTRHGQAYDAAINNLTEVAEQQAGRPNKIDDLMTQAEKVHHTFFLVCVCVCECELVSECVCVCVWRWANTAVAVICVETRRVSEAQMLSCWCWWCSCPALGRALMTDKRTFSLPAWYT